MPAIPGYELLEPLGQGGMGEVFRARRIIDGVIVAVKIIQPHLARDEEFRRRFRRESTLAESVSHPNVVKIHEAGETPGGVLFLAMDLVDGTDLQTLIDTSGHVSPHKAAPLLADTAAGLDAIHASGIIHRDIKPGNVLVRSGRPSEAFVTDFGLAKTIASATALTSQGMFLGTLDYSSPEQISGRPIDARSDIYSLACVYYHALAGEPPFPRDDTAAKLYAHVNEEPPSIARQGSLELGLLENVFSRALDKDPEQRFPSAGDFATAFNAALSGEAVTRKERFVGTGDAAPAKTQVQATRGVGGFGGGRRRWLVGVTALLALCLIGGSVIFFTSKSGDDEPPGPATSPNPAPIASADPAEEASDPVETESFFGAPPKGKSSTILDRGGTKETTIASYCSPTGDYCQKILDRSGDVILQMAQFSFGEGSYRICVEDPAADKQCEAFKWAPAGESLYEGVVDLVDNFEVTEPGTYTASWMAMDFEVGKPLSFRMMVDAGGVVASPDDVNGYIAQLGSFKTEVDARALSSELADEGVSTGILRSSQFQELEPGFWVVFSGPFANLDEADASSSASGVKGAFARPVTAG